MDPNEYDAEASDFKNALNVTLEQRNLIEFQTRGQTDNELWFKERKFRITASNFGLIVKRRESSKWSKLVDTFLYENKNFETSATRYGKNNEQKAIKAYEEKTGEEVTECGLFVDLKYGFLGASPDGVTKSGGIIEVKCPKTAKNMTIKEAIQSVKGFCLDANGHLKRNHNYFMQIQGQLHITGKPFCDFIVWTTKDISIERIYPTDIWNDRMLPKLVFFYDKALLPEIIDPRKWHSMQIREPVKE